MLFEKAKKPYGPEIHEFVNSNMFSVFDTITEQIYLSKLEDFQGKDYHGDYAELLADRKQLAFLCNICNSFKILDQEYIHQKKLEAEGNDSLKG